MRKGTLIYFSKGTIERVRVIFIVKIKFHFPVTAYCHVEDFFNSLPHNSDF